MKKVLLSTILMALCFHYITSDRSHDYYNRHIDTFCWYSSHVNVVFSMYLIIVLRELSIIMNGVGWNMSRWQTFPFAPLESQHILGGLPHGSNIFRPPPPWLVLRLYSHIYYPQHFSWAHLQTKKFHCPPPPLELYCLCRLLSQPCFHTKSE